MISSLLSYYILGALPLFFIYKLYQKYNRLRRVPGPWLAKFTDFYRLIVVWRRDSHDTYLALHNKYGDLVRTGPNCVSICKPNIIQSIYGIGKGFVKSDFYLPWQNIINGRRAPSLVFTTDEVQHAAMKRPIAPAYSLSNLMEFEPLIDSTTAVFLSRIDEVFANKDSVCDLGQWLQWYAFDVMGELTFSKRLGFLERGEDVEGICEAVGRNFDWCSVLGQMPWLDLMTRKNPLYLKLFATAVANPVVSFGQRRLQERLSDAGNAQNDALLDIKDSSLRDKIIHGILPSKPDFLSRFLTLHKEQPDVVTDRQLLAYLFMNINAGSDTIGSTLRAIFYYLLRDSRSLSLLKEELDEACRDNKLSTPVPTWAQCQSLPYLNAVIKEGLRLNPALALPLERVVPAGGLQLDDDTVIPKGTVVGINPWVLHRDPRVFGEDAAEWSPARWIADETTDPKHEAERIKFMEQSLLSFGAGKRTCLGRHIAMLELIKSVPALLMRYRIELANPERRWKVMNSWAVKQEGLDVRFTR